ncbi:MAG: Gfo/Idh/MocA family oxidoreductase [Clostridia bacterium]|nr:Gfo/Idh/MocA family oxidoreductase [Clostridia bacterium]
MKKTVKCGVFGLFRGAAHVRSILENNCDVVAVCDRDEKKLEDIKKNFGDKIAFYKDFDEFINHPGLEAVILANNYDQHVPFAIKALEKDIHVLSECTSNSTMADGVKLVRAVEKSKAIYMVDENCAFMKYSYELNRVFKTGTLGKILYAEGEYNHPEMPGDDDVMRRYRPYPKHWRNFLPRSYYITHSLGPLMYITGAMPKRVTAMPVFAPNPSDSLMGLDVGDRAAIITTLNDDDSVFRVTGCAAFGGHGLSFRLCGVKGQVENLRDGTDRILLTYNEWDTPEGVNTRSVYLPEWKDKDKALIEASTHGGGDFVATREFLNCIKEGKQPILDVYFATTMASVGILAWRSILDGSKPYDIPDFRKEEDKIKYENDYLTPFYGPNGQEPTLPCCSHPDYKPNEKAVEEYLKIVEKK